MTNQTTETKETTPNGQEVARSVSNDLLSAVTCDDVLSDISSLLNKLGRVHNDSNPVFVTRLCHDAMREIVRLVRRVEELENKPCAAIQSAALRIISEPDSGTTTADG